MPEKLFTSEPAAAPEGHEVVPWLGEGGRLRILIVDDHADWVMGLAELVSGWGYNAREARTGAEARRIAAEFRPRVVFLDLGLPDRHGYDVARSIRDDARRRNIFFVAITGWTQLADQLRSGAAGISHHLVKPVNADVLREILGAYQASERVRPGPGMAASGARR